MSSSNIPPCYLRAALLWVGENITADAVVNDDDDDESTTGDYLIHSLNIRDDP